jgi:phospholipid-translocating ATPase
MQASATYEGGREGLDLNNCGWASTVLSTGEAWGLVVYTGREMRTALNSRAPRNKFGQVDADLNRLSKWLFVVMCVVSGVLVLMRGASFEDWGQSLFLFMNYVILLSNVIPISMRVNLDFAKLYYSWLIDRDHSIHETIVRNSNIPE